MIDIRRSLILFLFFLFMMCGVESKEPSAERGELLSELLEIQGLNYIGDEYAQYLAIQLNEIFTSNGVELSSEVFNALTQVTSEVFFEELIYSGELQRLLGRTFKDFSVSELHDLVEFYQSELGQKLLAIEVDAGFFESADTVELEQKIADKVEAKLLERFGDLGLDIDSLVGPILGKENAGFGPSEAELSDLIAKKCIDVEKSTKPLPIYRGSPSYPKIANAHGVDGWVELDFTVNNDGRTSDIVVTNASTGTLFNDAAIAAVKNYRYCSGRETESTKIRVRFEMERDGKLTRGHPAIKRLEALGEHEFRFVSTQRFLNELNIYANRRSRKALVIAYEGDEWFVYWSHGHRSKEQASSQAIQRCNESRANMEVAKECHLFLVGSELVGNYKKLDILNEVTNSLHGKSFEEKSSFEISIERYLKLENKKAFAISEEPDGAYYFYQAHGWKKQRNANRHALSKCEENKPSEFEVGCRLYMVGDRVVDKM